MTSNFDVSRRGGFTLIELMVVLGIVAMLMAAFASSLAGAQRRAKIAKAESEVNLVTQAVLAYENYDEIPQISSPKPVGADTLGFLLGGKSEVPVLLQAALTGGGSMMDPWNRPYTITIRSANESVTIKTASGSLKTGYTLPNIYRLTKEERTE